MTTEIATLEPAPLAELPSPTSPMEMLLRTDLRAFDADKAHRLMEMAMQWEDRQADKALAAALAEFQRIAPVIGKNKSGDRGVKYASYDKILIFIREPLSQCGLSVSFDGEFSETSVTAICHIRHVDGGRQTTRFTVPIDNTKTREGKSIMNDSQKAGSADSYAKRYALVAALNLIVSDHDDDGHAAGSAVITSAEGDGIQDMLDKFPNPAEVRTGMLRWIGVGSVYEIPTARLREVTNEICRKAKAKGVQL